MTYQFPHVSRQLIDQNMASGGYASEDQVLQVALRVLSEYHDTAADIREGIEDEHAGRLRTLSDVDAEIREEFGFSKFD